jgi:hypothetical protein
LAVDTGAADRGELRLQCRSGSVGLLTGNPFEFGDREPAVLQPFGWEVDALLEAHRAAQSVAAQDGVRWDALAEVVLMTTSRGPFEEDVFFMPKYDDGSGNVIPLGEGQELLPRLQALPGFDNETFIRRWVSARKASGVLWRR